MMHNTIKGIVLDEMNFDQIRACGFTDFRVEDDEMNYNDEERYQEWCNDQHDKIKALSNRFMSGMEDAKYFFFSDVEAVVARIEQVFPGCEVITVTDSELEDDYSLDYDYRRDL